MEIDIDSPPVQQSYLHWYVSSLGMPTILLIVGATLLAGVLILVLFLRGRGPAVPAAIAFVLPLPLLVGLMCFLGGSISFLNNVAINGPPAAGARWFAYGTLALMHASSCFCPLLMLTLVFLMMLGFWSSKKKG